MKTIDLRSDTLTKPSPEMLKAITNADLGDDVFEEDPTVNKLENLAAQIIGKDAAILTTSGTQSNLIASILHNPPGSETIADYECHIFKNEVAGTARFAGAQIKPIHTKNGILTVDDIEKNIRANNIHYPRTTSIFIENTHNMAGGTIYPLSTLKELKDIAIKKNLKIHMDGARIFNAQEASGVSVKEMANWVNTVTFCLSKGLGCPVGAILAGDKETIIEARRLRKALGGGLRQAGIIAAAGIYALENNIKRLKEDHKNAQLLANALKNMKHKVNSPETNIVLWDTKNDASKTCEDLKQLGLLALPTQEKRIRFVTHLDVSRADIEQAIFVLKDYLGSQKTPI